MFSVLKPGGPVKLIRENKIGLLILLAILILNFLFLKYNTFRHFNFYDMCYSLDGGWRILCGQKPYKDFLYFNGPIHLYLNALFFLIFGFGKTAILAHLVCIHSLVIIAVYLLAYKYLKLGISILLTMLTTASFYWPVSFPWHDQTAFFFVIMAFVLTGLNLKNTELKHAFIVSFMVGLLSLLSLMSKTNIGGITGISFFMFFLSLKGRVKLLGGFLGGVLAGTLLTLFLIPTPVLYLSQMLDFFHFQSSLRTTGFLKIHYGFINYYWLSLLIIVPNAFPHLRKCYPWFIIYVSIFFISIVSTLSGAIIMEAYIFLWGIYMTAAFILLNEVKELDLNRVQRSLYKTSSLLLIAITTFLLCVSVKHGLELKVWTYGGRVPQGDYALKAKALKGWLFYKNEGEALDKLAAYINSYVPREDSLLVLTDMQILYALTGRDSYRGIPLNFIHDISPTPGEQLTQVSRHLHDNLPIWIVFHLSNFMVEFPYLKLDDEIEEYYEHYYSWGLYAIFKKVR